MGNEAITPNLVISDWVSWVVEVEYEWGKVNEVTRSQKTRPQWTCFEVSGGRGNG